MLQNVLLYFYCMKFSIDMSEDLKAHLEKEKEKRNIKSLGAFIKAVLRKATKYKERELV